MRPGQPVIYTVAVASGQGHETAFPQILADMLGIAPERITAKGGHAGSQILQGAGAFGSRSIMSLGSATRAAGRKMLETASRLAADALGVAPEAVSYDGGLFTSTCTNRALGLDELARAQPGALDTLVELPAPRAFPSGAHVAEVEIDPETGTCALLRYVSVDDCGTVVNRTLVEGQMIGGLV